MKKHKPRYTVRKQASGYSGSVRWYVYDTAKKERVSVHAALTRDTAQASADELNISDLVPPHDEDSRPYEVRLAEAREKYLRQANRPSGKPLIDIL